MADLPAPGPSNEERTLALVGHALTFVEGGIVGPLVLYLIKKDESEFVAFHALQSLIFGVLAAAVVVPVTLVTCGAGAVLIIPYFLFEVVACFRAYEGEWYQLPIAGPMAYRNHHP